MGSASLNGQGHERKLFILWFNIPVTKFIHVISLDGKPRSILSKKKKRSSKEEAPGTKGVKGSLPREKEKKQSQ